MSSHCTCLVKYSPNCLPFLTLWLDLWNITQRSLFRTWWTQPLISILNKFCKSPVNSCFSSPSWLLWNLWLFFSTVLVLNMWPHHLLHRENRNLRNNVLCLFVIKSATLPYCSSSCTDSSCHLGSDSARLDLTSSFSFGQLPYFSLFLSIRKKKTKLEIQTTKPHSFQPSTPSSPFAKCLTSFISKPIERTAYITSINILISHLFLNPHSGSPSYYSKENGLVNITK